MPPTPKRQEVTTLRRAIARGDTINGDLVRNARWYRGYLIGEVAKLSGYHIGWYVGVEARKRVCGDYSAEVLLTLFERPTGREWECRTPMWKAYVDGAEAFGAQMRELREASGLCLQHFARSLDVPPRSLRRWEGGTRLPLERLVRRAIVSYYTGDPDSDPGRWALYFNQK